MTAERCSEFLLETLCRSFERPFQLEKFAQSCRCDALTVQLAGYAARDDAGHLFYGSAASQGEDPGPRAAWELIERLAVHWVRQLDPGQRLAARTATGEFSHWLELDAVFPEVPPGPSHSVSISNGVAAHQDWIRAGRAARLELIERDRVLRSWYGAGRPRKLSIPAPWFAGGLDGAYRLEGYAIDHPHALDLDVAVCAALGLPRCDSTPLLLCFGAAESVEGALQHAAQELLQRAGFLWEDPIPDREPQFEPSPSYHMNYYLWPGSRSELRRWLRGERELAMERAQSGPEPCVLVDLTPDPIAAELRVAKAIAPRRLPLAFGDYAAFRAAAQTLHPCLGELGPARAAGSHDVHPIA